ncbi:hypothetical protein J2X65_003193 [Ancylobacter sp. 3268]|uniref:hypothetical protein n=1 Tax=Ancylobacter sp. 3268 TaxID=2817752 RepID=UPI00285E3ECC|nr:hypothetical protein [Ancylobacter sp. 3268]MDR6953830.1 hypothetical protein [Ancylobacter sp. 3268]
MAELAPAPYRLSDDLTVTAADGSTFCVIGDPFASPTERDRLHGAVVVLLPEILEVFGIFTETFAMAAMEADYYPEAVRALKVFEQLKAAGYRGRGIVS